MLHGVFSRFCYQLSLFAVWLHQSWHTSALVFVVYGELLAACFSRAGLHCVETLQLLLLLLLLPSLPSPLLSLTSPALACEMHRKTCLTLLRKQWDFAAAPDCLSIVHFDFFLYSLLRAALKHLCPSSCLLAKGSRFLLMQWCLEMSRARLLPLNVSLPLNCSAGFSPAVYRKL